MRINFDTVLLAVMAVCIPVGWLLEPVALKVAGRFLDLGGAALIVFVVRRLYFLPHWILTGRER